MTSSNPGSRIRHLRKAAGLKSRELDRLAGLKTNHIANIERRDGEITVKVAREVARVLGTTIEHLCFGVGDPPSPEKSSAAVEAARALQKEHSAPIAGVA